MITLDQARTKPSLCQEYLDSLDLGDLRSRTRSIIYGDVPGTLYDADGEPDENGLAVTLYPHSGSEPGMKPCIRVFSKFFDGKCIKNVDDALSALGDHERAHVLQYEDKTQLDIKLMSYAVDRAEEYFRLNAMKRMATQNLKSPSRPRRTSSKLGRRYLRIKCKSMVSREDESQRSSGKMPSSTFSFAANS